MAAIPAGAATAGLSVAATQALTFAVNLGASYLLTRLTAQDGPRLDNLAAGGGEYGVAMPRAYGETVRLTGIFIAQVDIKETKHTVEDYSELIGAATGALEGFLLGGPVGALIGGAIGGLLGFAMPDQHYYTYSDSFALLLADRTGMDPIEGIGKIVANGKQIFSGAEAIMSQTLDANGKLIVRKYGQNRYFKSLTVYGGSTLQGVDPLLAALLGETGAYPFSAFLVFEDLQLAPFGNSVPPMEALTRVATGQSIADTVESIAAAAGIDPMRDFSSTALTDFLNRGYTVTSESNCWDAVKPLLPAFAIDAAEVAGQVRFYRRAQTMRATIPLGDMGAHADGDGAPALFTFDRNPDLKLPKETSLTFLDPARDYLPNTATSRRSEGDAKSNITASIPLALTAGEGASAAALMHWDAWLGRTALGFALTDNWNPVVGQAYAIPVANQDGGQAFLPYRIQRSTRGANGITEIEAVSDEEVTYSASVPGTSGTPPDDDSTEMPDTRVVIIDMPITADDHDDYGFYLAIAGTASYWPRGYVQFSGDGGAHWATVLDTPQSAVMGDAMVTLPAGPTYGLDDTLDAASVLDVELLHDGMELASATDAELDIFKNFAFLGKDGQGEYLQYKTAAKLAPKIWRLTNLRRGRKGTDWALALHGSGEEFVLFGGAGVARAVYSDTLKWGVPFKARGITLHQDAADAAIVDFTNTGEGKRPYSPVDVEGSWDGSFNLTLTFDHRSRMNSGALGFDDNFEFDVEFTSGTPRSVTVTIETVAYTAAQQVADGIVPGDTIAGRVRQTSDVNDGRWRNFELIGPNTIVSTETDIAQMLGMLIGLAARRADESDTALALIPPVTTPVGRADETASALALSTIAGASVGRADETDTALALTATALDAYFDNVVFLSGFEGTNGSTSFTDESVAAHAMTALGNAQISTAQKKYGSSAYLGDGTGDGITMADSEDWNVGASNYTIEAFIRFASVGDCHIMSQGGGPVVGLFYEGGRLKIEGGSCAPLWSPSANTWYHVVGERAGTVLRIYVDGAMLSGGKTTGYTAANSNIAAVMNLGNFNGAGTGSLNGYLDEVRMTYGIARYNSDSGYSVPAAAFPRSGPVSSGTYRYFKFLTSGNNGASGAVLAQELSVAQSNGGTNIAQYGRVSGSVGFFSGAEGPDKAINQNTGDWWQPATGGNIVWDFLTKRDLHEIIWTPHPSFLDRTPTSIQVIGSNDPTFATSTTLHTFSSLTSWSGARTLQW